MFGKRSVPLTLIFSAALATVAAFLLTANVNGQDSKKSLADLLIDAGLRQQTRIKNAQQGEADVQKQSQQMENELRTADLEQKNLQGSKPVLENAWKSLQAGEFERKNDFVRRQNEEKAREHTEFERREREWKRAVLAREGEVRNLRDTADSKMRLLDAKAKAAREETARALWEQNTLPLAPRVLTAKELPLPRFNQETMSFEPLVVEPFGEIKLQSSQSPNQVAKIVESTGARLRLKLPSLETAKSFKDRFESGEIACVVIGGLDLTGAESPILVQREIVETKETYATDGNAGRLAGAFAIGLLAQALGTAQE